ncbi:C1q-related factor-like [Mytilus edulis]|uniref:C1q-related factor-like n=1 Tax=Mytilus edulis TaxID=6550 RepID=UPI0039EDEF3C
MANHVVFFVVFFCSFHLVSTVVSAISYTETTDRNPTTSVYAEQTLSLNFELVLKRLENLEKENQLLKVANVELSTKTLRLEEKSDQLEESNIVLVEEVKKIKESLETKTNLNPEIAENEKNDDRSKSKKSILVGGGKNATTPVGFTAVLTHDVTLGPHQTLEYDKVLTNIGNGYDVRHGYFTVPISGLYIVSATTCSGANEGIWTEIVRNGIQLVALYGDDYDFGSHTIVVSLEQNDEVWVRNYASSGTVHSIGTRYYSSFSGVLIAAA